MRLVLGPEGAIAVDLAGGSFGRGAHVHPSPACFAKAPKGLARSFRAPVRASAADLASALREAADRRVEGLLASAVRSGRAVVGADAVVAGLGSGEVALVVVACDAAAAAQLPAVARAVAEGRSVAWGDRQRLGDLARKPEVAVLGVTAASIAQAIATAVRFGSSVASTFVAAEDR